LLKIGNSGEGSCIFILKDFHVGMRGLVLGLALAAWRPD